MVLYILAELANLHRLKLKARWFQTNGRNFSIGANDLERHRQASVSLTPVTSEFVTHAFSLVLLRVARSRLWGMVT